MNEPWNKKKRSDEDFFSDFDFGFGGIDRMMNDLVKRMFSDSEEFDGRPITFGFSMRTDAEGNPVIKRFGNIQAREGRPVVVDRIEPLVDVVEEEKEIVITAELPGVKKEEINLKAEDENTVVLQVDNAERPYFKVINLQKPVKEDSAKASFKNGILEAHFKKLAQRKEKEKGQIKIE